MSVRSLAAQLPPRGEPKGWYAFRTMYKREKVAAKRLGARGIETYVPLRTVVRHYASKTVTSRIPLLSTYLFARIDAGDYPVVLADADVFEVVQFRGEVGRVTDEEVAFLRAVLRDGGGGGGEGGEEFEPKAASAPLSPGRRVAVAGGALAGTRGVIVEGRGKHNFVVELRNLGVAVELIVGQHLLEPIDFG